MSIRMKRDVVSILGVTITFGILLSYPISIASGAMIFLASEFVMNALTKSCVVCFVIVGAMLGILGGGAVADLYGRKKAVLLAGIFLFVGSFFSACIHDFKELLFFRLLTGVGIGISSMVVPVYLSEIALPRYRGKVVSLFQVAITLGILISYLINLFLYELQSWRIGFGVSAVFAFAALVFIYFMPESPSWLISKGDVESARDLLTRLYPNKDSEVVIEKAIEAKKTKKNIRVRDLFRGGLKKALYIGLLLTVFQQITGINAVIYYAPEIFQQTGILNLYMKFLATVALGVLNVGTAFLSMRVIDSWGRRNLLISGILGMILSLAILGLFFHNSILAVVGLVGFIFFFGIGLGPVVWVVTAEIFPLEIRGKAVSLVLFVNWFVSLIVAGGFLFVVDLINIEGAFWIFAAMSLLSFFFVYFWVPETKGKSLEEIQEYWQKSK
jgi:SP family galactose:H+ symporter-like MFS transporter